MIGGGAMGQDPFRDYLTKSYVRAIRLGKFAIYLKKDSQPRRPSNIWLLYGARDFATSSDTLPLIDSLLAGRKSSTLSLWFRTRRNGVLLGLQNEKGTQRQPALYVGIDGELRGGFVSRGLTEPPFVSAAPVNDGQWHHVVLQVRKTQQTMFLDEVSLGTVDSQFQLEAVPVAQLGAGSWRGFVGGNSARWKVFRGRIQNVVLAPGVVSPKVLALLGPSPK